MQTVHFLIEKTNGGYTSYSEELGILSDGKTIKQTQANSREGVKEQCEITGENPDDFNIVFRYDVAAAFDALKPNVTTLAARSGINGSLISQYASGKKKPALKQKQRIEAALHDYARDILSVHIA